MKNEQERELADKKPSWDKVQKDYSSWVKKITFVPIKLTGFISLLSVIVSIILIIIKDAPWHIYLLLIVFAFSKGFLEKRMAHREGYMDGYRDGYDQGRDDVLGIDDEARDFIDTERAKSELEKK